MPSARPVPAHRPQSHERIANGMTAPSTYLGFDYGAKRVGAAVGDDLTRSARPLPTIPTGDWRSIERLLTDFRPAALIVGLPINEDGSEQPITGPARRFASELGQRYGLAVHAVDERFSSRAADDDLRAARGSGRMKRRVRKGDRDAHAARIVLEQWLNT